MQGCPSVCWFRVVPEEKEKKMINFFFVLSVFKMSMEKERRSERGVVIDCEDHLSDHQMYWKRSQKSLESEACAVSGWIDPVGGLG